MIKKIQIRSLSIPFRKKFYMHFSTGFVYQSCKIGQEDQGILFFFYRKRNWRANHLREFPMVTWNRARMWSSFGCNFKSESKSKPKLHKVENVCPEDWQSTHITRHDGWVCSSSTVCTREIVFSQRQLLFIDSQPSLKRLQSNLCWSHIFPHAIAKHPSRHSETKLDSKRVNSIALRVLRS